MRIWEVQFQVYDRMESFPMPGELVEEIQKTPNYRIDELNRPSHRGGQLSCTLKGRGIFRDGEKNREYELTPGTAFFSLHGFNDISYFYPPEEKEPWVTLWISFFGSASEKMMNEIISRHGYIFNLPLDTGIIKTLRLYRNYDRTVHPLTSSSGAKMVMDIFTTLTEKGEDIDPHPHSNDLIRQVRQYILENTGVDYGVSDVAQALNISREHLSRVFSKKMEINLIEYIRKHKIRRACHLLRETRLSCCDIGSKIGYNNSASFNRVFKTVTGLTPKQFRETSYIPNL